MTRASSVLELPGTTAGAVEVPSLPEGAVLTDRSGAQGWIETWSSETVTIRFGEASRVAVPAAALVRQPRCGAYSLPLSLVELDRYQRPLCMAGSGFGAGRRLRRP
jgi:hypothetical protein